MDKSLEHSLRRDADNGNGRLARNVPGEPLASTQDLLCNPPIFLTYFGYDGRSVCCEFAVEIPPKVTRL